VPDVVDVVVVDAEEIARLHGCSQRVEVDEVGYAVMLVQVENALRIWVLV
jgi:hypothetical protein